METTRFAEQEIKAAKIHLQNHRHAWGNQWIRNSLKRWEVNPLLCVLITMGVVGYPTQR